MARVPILIYEEPFCIRENLRETFEAFDLSGNLNLWRAHYRELVLKSMSDAQKARQTSRRADQTHIEQAGFDSSQDCSAAILRYSQLDPGKLSLERKEIAGQIRQSNASRDAHPQGGRHEVKRVAELAYQFVG